MVLKKSFFVLAVSLGFGLPVAAQAVEDPAIALVRDGLRQARDSIRTIYAKYKIVIPPRPPGSPPERYPPLVPLAVEWWQDGDLVRYRHRANFKDEEYLWKGGGKKSLWRNRPLGEVSEQLSGEISSHVDNYSVAFNLWRSCLFEEPLLSPHPLCSELLAPSFAPEISTVQDGGKKYYRVAYTLPVNLPKRRSEIWVDPKRNYLVVKCIREQKDSDYVIECISAREVKPGIFFPTVLESRRVREGKPTLQRTFQVLELRVNDPIDPKVFEWTFPRGTSVSDREKGVLYKIGKDGQPLAKTYPLPTPAKPADVSPRSIRYQTGDPRGELSGWVFWGIMGLAAAIVVAIAWRVRVYWRRRAA